MPFRPVIDQPVAPHLNDPSRGDFATRLRSIEDRSFGTLPTRLSLELAQSHLADHQIERASQLLAHQFDLSPWEVLRVYGPMRKTPEAQQYVDPVSGGPMSFATARRFLQLTSDKGIAEKLIRNALRAQPQAPTQIVTPLGRVRGVDYNHLDAGRLRETFAAMAPVSGEHVSFMTAFGAATTIAYDQDVDLKLFKQNLEMTSRFQALSPELQIAAAHQAARRNKAIQNPGDIASALVPEAAGAVKAGKELTQWETDPQSRISSGLRPGGVKQPTIEAEFGQKITAGLSSADDWLGLLQDAQDDYIKAADALKEELHVPAPLSWAGRMLGAGLNRAFRPYEAIYRFVSDPDAVLAPFGKEAAYGSSSMAGTITTRGGETNIQLALQDAFDIWHGRATAAETLEKAHGTPSFATGIGELILGFYFDPMQIGMNSWSAFKAARSVEYISHGARGFSVQTARDIMLERQGARLLKTGQATAAIAAGDWRVEKAVLLGLGDAADARAAEYIAKGNAWLNGSVRRLGGLRHTDIDTYLLREIDRTKNAELFYDRIIGTFRKTFSTGPGIDWQTAEHIWRWAKGSKGLGVSEADRLLAIKAFRGAGLGIPVEIGSLAHEVEILTQVKRAQASEVLAAAVEARPTVKPSEQIVPLGPMPYEGHQAMSALDDLAADLAGGQLGRMTEIPHMNLPGSPQWIDNMLRTSPLADTQIGRTVRSVMATNPIRAGAHVVLDIEGGAESIRDFERALIRAKYSPQEIAEGKLAFAKAIDRTNPTREADFTRIVGHYASETLRREDRRMGATKEIRDAVVDKLEARLGGSKKRQAFAAYLSDPIQRERSHTLFQTIARSESPEAVEAARAELNVLAHEGAMATMPKAFLRSTFLNTAEFIDPVLYRTGLSEIMGTFRKYDREMAKALGMDLKDPALAKLRLRAFTDRALEHVITGTVLAIWKPLAVIRPAYILRIVGLEETARFLGVSGLWRRLQAGKHTGPLLQDMGWTTERMIPLGVKPAEEIGQRDSTIEDAVLFLSDRHEPGVLDFRGWSRSDSPLGESLADILRNGGFLDETSRANARRLIQTYKSQLSTIGIDVDKLKVRGNPIAAADGARARQADIDEGLLRLRVPGALPDESQVNNVGTVRELTTVTQGLGREMQRIDASRWVGKERSDPGFREFWHHALVHQFGQDPIGRRYLAGFGQGWDEEKVVERTMDWLTTKGGPGEAEALHLMHGVEEFSRADLEYSVRIGAAYVNDLIVGRTELARAAHSGALTVEQLKMIADSDLPLFVHGPMTTEMVTAHVGPFKRARDFFGRWILQEPTNRLTRQPFFKDNYDAMYEGLIRVARQQGREVTPEMLKGFSETARQHGISQVKRVMFDFSRTGRFEEMTRFQLVFVQPYLEEPLAWGRIIRQNPAFAWHATRLVRGGLRSGFLKTDPETGELMIPASWWFAAAPLLALATGTHIGKGKFAGGGWELSIPAQAFNLFASGTLGVNLGEFGGTNFPVPLPSFNPVAQGVMQRFVQYAQDHDITPGVTARLASWLNQYGEVGPNNLMGLAPSWIRHGLEAMFPQQFQRNTDFLATHFLKVQQAMGQTPDPGHAIGQAQWYSAMRMFQAWFFPGAPRVDFPTSELDDEHASLVAPIDEGGMGYIEGEKKWRELHPDLWLFSIARTVWNKEDPTDPLQSPIPIPATQAVSQLLNSKGAREFAKAHPSWVWAIIPEELATGELDRGIFSSMIAKKDLLVRSPYEFLSEGALQNGWDVFFDFKDDWTAWQEANPIFGEGDQPYEREKDAYDADVRHLGEENPAWWTDYQNHLSTSGLDQKVEGEARQLAKDPMFTKTEVGKGLAEYMPLYDSIKADLSDENITLASKAAETLGIKARYEDEVAAIIERHPQFATAYRLFFEKDALLANVKGAGKIWRDSIPESTWEATYTPWYRRFEELRHAPDAAPTIDERNAAYGALRDWVNRAYNTFSTSENPMIGAWKSWAPDRKNSYMLGVIGRPYQFQSRFDKQTVMGERSNKSTEALWDQYEALRSNISLTEASDFDNRFSSTDAYKALGLWVQANAVTNPVFAEQVAHANTWGYAFQQTRDQLFPAGDAAKPSWDAFLAGVQQYQLMAQAAGLHGFGDQDKRKVALYTAIQTALLGYVATLKERSVAFAAQWDYLEEQSRNTPAISYFQPEIYYPVGSTT